MAERTGIEGNGPLSAWRRHQRLVGLVRQYAGLRHPGEQVSVKARRIAEAANESLNAQVTYEHHGVEEVVVLDQGMLEWQALLAPLGLTGEEMGLHDDPRVMLVVLDGDGRGRAQEVWAVSREWGRLGRRVRALEAPALWLVTPVEGDRRRLRAGWGKASVWAEKADEGPGVGVN